MKHIAYIIAFYLFIFATSCKDDSNPNAQNVASLDSISKKAEKQSKDTLPEDTAKTAVKRGENNLLKEDVEDKKTLFRIGGKFVSYKNQKFAAYVVNLKKDKLTFNFKNSKNKNIKTFINLKNYYKKKNKELVFATNGGIFQENYNPEGIYIENGKELFPLNLDNGHGNFYMKPNGVFYINKWGGNHIVRSKSFKKSKHIKFAAQSGPLLVFNGKISKNFGKKSVNKKTRSGVGKINDSTVVFIISLKPVNFYDFASVFKNKFKCKNALYLDGVISRMYAPEIKMNKVSGNFSTFISLTKNIK